MQRNLGWVVIRLQTQRSLLCYHLALEIRAAKLGMGCDIPLFGSSLSLGLYIDYSLMCVFFFFCIFCIYNLYIAVDFSFLLSTLFFYLVTRLFFILQKEKGLHPLRGLVTLLLKSDFYKSRQAWYLCSTNLCYFLLFNLSRDIWVETLIL